MKSKNRTLVETARCLAFQHAMQRGWTYAEWEYAISKRRTRPAVEARRELAAFLRRIGFSFTVIGAALGRDHASVMSALDGLAMPEPKPGPGYHATEVGTL